MSVSIVRPTMKYMDSFVLACRELREAGLYAFVDFKEDPSAEQKAALLEKFANAEKGRGLPEGWVPYSTFWLVDDPIYIGTGYVRHALTDKLKRFGGHIGYYIRPSMWGKGHGTFLLSMLLTEAAGLGIADALLTCFEENAASRRVMEKNGAVHMDTITNMIDGRERMTRRYSIKTGK